MKLVSFESSLQGKNFGTLPVLVRRIFRKKFEDHDIVKYPNYLSIIP